ncbi:MAG: Phr family secreted Rap phosphatase inhibitor [Candidatus Moranbacteria bacterium]|nr:Phr family secreted Rap phosphatase inhibitor [Candidatus Moranbacteria bacterium]
MMKKHSDILMGLSVLAALVSGFNFLFKADIFGLAGTQWMLIALILAVYGIYVKLRM